MLSLITLILEVFDNCGDIHLGVWYYTAALSLTNNIAATRNLSVSGFWIFDDLQCFVYM